MIRKPKMTIIHRLPSRVRIHISTAIKNDIGLVDFVNQHNGIKSVSYSKHTKNALVKFDSQATNVQDVIARLVIFVAKESNFKSIIVHDHTTLQDWSALFYPLATILGSSIMQKSGKNSRLKSNFTRGAVISLILTLVSHLLSENKTTAEFKVHEIKDKDGNVHYDTEVIQGAYLSVFSGKAKAVLDSGKKGGKSQMDGVFSSNPLTKPTEAFGGGGGRNSGGRNQMNNTFTNSQSSPLTKAFTTFGKGAGGGGRGCKF